MTARTSGFIGWMVGGLHWVYEAFQTGIEFIDWAAGVEIIASTCLGTFTALFINWLWKFRIEPKLNRKSGKNDNVQGQ